MSPKEERETQEERPGMAVEIDGEFLEIEELESRIVPARVQCSCSSTSCACTSTTCLIRSS